jgi:predicted nucleic acid-binding protein
VIVVDTTLLLYAVGSDHPLRAPAQAFLGLLGEGAVEATTTVEVVQEFVHVRARRRSRADAVTLARRYATALGPLVRPGENSLNGGLSLFEHHPRLGAFDAVLAETARSRGWPVASADSAFGEVDGLRWLDLAAPGFLQQAQAG